MYAPRRADEKARSEILLQLRHLLADHGLGDSEPLGRPRERSGIDDRREIGQPIEVHGSIMASPDLIVSQ